MAQVTYYDDYLQYKEDYDIIESCPECPSLNIIYDPERDEIVCHQCGLVLKSSDKNNVLGPTVQAIEDTVDWKNQTISIKGFIGPARGGVYNPMMKNPYYRVWRKKVLKRDGFQCMYPGCGETEYLHVHHVYNVKSHPELRYEVSNGATLCRDHHIDFHREYKYYGNSVWELISYFHDRWMELNSLGF